jgi:hypothetical protein
MHSEEVQCPNCETVYIVTKGFALDKFLEILKKQHQANEGHPDHIASEPAFTSTSNCDCAA